MPDRDPLQQLASFGTGGPVDPLPATEVRRLGDRRRARRTAVSAVTGVVAVLAVVVPAGLYAARDGGGHPLPPSSSQTASATPTPEQSPSGGWRTDIPAGFPLDRDLEPSDGGEKLGPSREAAGINEPDPCVNDEQWQAWPQEYAARLGARATGPEHLEGRELITLRDASTAARVLDNLREMLGMCRPPHAGSDPDTTWTPLDTPVLGDDTLAVSHLEKVGLGGDVYLFTRVGNAVLALDVYGEWAPETAPRGVDDLRGTAEPLVAAMCIYAVDPCGDPSDGPSDSTTPDGTVDHATTAIPSDFPIGLGSPDLGDAATVNGTPAGERMTHADPCASKGILDRAPVDRLDYDLMGPEFTEQRELRTYTSPEAAQAALDNLATAAAACPTQELKTGVTATWTVLERSTGYHSVTVARTLGEEGGFTWQYTRVGLAIFGVVWLGEGGSPEQIRINADELTAITKQVAPKMCPFTQAGC